MSYDTVHCTGEGAYMLGNEFAFMGEEPVECISADVACVCGDSVAWSDVRGADKHSG